LDSPTNGTCNLDVTACPIRKPSQDEKDYWSAKHKAHVLKYEVAVHPHTGRIVWVFGAIPGAIHDITIARARFIQQLLPEE